MDQLNLAIMIDSSIIDKNRNSFIDRPYKLHFSTDYCWLPLDLEFDLPVCPWYWWFSFIVYICWLIWLALISLLLLLSCSTWPYLLSFVLTLCLLFGVPYVRFLFNLELSICGCGTNELFSLLVSACVCVFVAYL